MTDEIETEKYISKKEYLKKYDSNVGYAIHIQNNIKRDDYVRLNTGEIVKVIGIKENNVTKKAIYYGVYDTDWFDSSAVENFSANPIDLIQIGDFVNGRMCIDIEEIITDDGRRNLNLVCIGGSILELSNTIVSILTHEKYEQNVFKVVE